MFLVIKVVVYSDISALRWLQFRKSPGPHIQFGRLSFSSLKTDINLKKKFKFGINLELALIFGNADKEHATAIYTGICTKKCF